MHLTLTIVLFSIALWKGDWKNWRKYLLTIQYVIICNLLYNTLCHDHLLWQYKADFLPSKHVIVEIFYTFINLPSVTLLFLTFYPFEGSLLKQCRFILYWVLGSLMIEFPFVHFERLLLKNGYKYWMDIFFYITMFLMIRLHFSRQFLTYGISVIIIVFLLWVFHVPIK